MKSNKFTRREFIKTGSMAAAATLLVNYPDSIFAQQSKSRVVLVRSKDVLDKYNRINNEELRRMLDEAMKTLFETKNASLAWKKIIKPEDVVGIKSNVWRYLRTPLELESILRGGIESAGVSKQNISVNDQGILRDPVFKKATALINARPMRTHYWAGVGSLIKNYIMFVDKPSDYHPDSCADLASIWFLPHVNGKTRLNVLVMLTPLFHSVGPHGFNSDYVWQYGGLIVGVDPVACDAVGLKIIEAKRREFFGEDKPLDPPAKHIGLADTRHHLGTADMNKIELIKLGNKEGILI